MTLNEWSAGKKMVIFEELKAGQPPSEGEYDASLLREGLAKGMPQVGATHYEPHRVHLEFMFPEHGGSATVFSVVLTPPERIVFVPVPSWVVEEIWQGSIDGSYHFESDAQRLLAEFTGELQTEPNAKHFGPKQATRRE